MSDECDDIKEKYRFSPHKSGVYIFRDASGKPIYIGKARDLKNRLASYVFGKTQSIRISQMLRKAKKLEWIVTDNELEALILEANLVRIHKPKYNVELKDDKRYPYIKITSERFPRIVVVRRKENDGAKYFGPYADRMGAVKLMRTIRSLFKMRVCKYEIPPKRPMRPCVLFDIGRCLAPCVGACSQEEYSNAVNEVVMFLGGRRSELLKRMHSQMHRAAQQLKFEKAAILRDKITQLERMMTPQKMDSDLGDRDFIAIAVGDGVGIAVLFRVRQGAMIARHAIPLSVPKTGTIGETLCEFILHFYAENGDVPPEVLVQKLPAETNDIAEVLSKLRGKSVVVRVPQRGEKHKTLLLVQRNAQLLHTEMLIQKQRTRIPYSIVELEQLLGLQRTPNRIEAFDISNIGGDVVVGSMVQFIGGRANRKGYRHFHIRSFVGQDDFAAMREVVSRRYSRIITDGKPLPDLVLIDGGKGQLSAANDALQKLNVAKKISLVAIAKRIDELFIAGQKDSVMLPKDSAALRLLQRIRNEAHRFAIEFSRKSHRKKAMQMELMEVPNIGEKRAIKLLKEFGGMEAIIDASIAELVERGGLPKNAAIALKEHFAKK